LLIDHDMSLIFAICDPIYVLEFGQIIACGSPEDLRTNPRVVEAYLGQPDAADLIDTDNATTTPGSSA
jgi:branched-chain amino acid transport system ATP-binding protein